MYKSKNDSLVKDIHNKLKYSYIYHMLVPNYEHKYKTYKKWDLIPSLACTSTLVVRSLRTYNNTTICSCANYTIITVIQHKHKIQE